MKTQCRSINASLDEKKSRKTVTILMACMLSEEKLINLTLPKPGCAEFNSGYRTVHTTNAMIIVLGASTDCADATICSHVVDGALCAPHLFHVTKLERINMTV